MAEGKNNVIVYRDWLKNFEELTDEELGKLMRHFFMYINDLNPELNDRLLKIAWKPIEATLKRDLKKWDKKSEERSKSGILGNLKKYYIDLYNLVVSGDLDIYEAQKTAKHRIAIHSDTKHADSDSDNDSDNKEIYKEDFRFNLIQDILSFWNFEIDNNNHSAQRSLTNSFVSWLIANNKLDNFKEQFEAYKKYHSGDQKKYNGTLKTFLGYIGEWNGRWQDENWIEKINGNGPKLNLKHGIIEATSIEIINMLGSKEMYVDRVVNNKQQFVKHNGKICLVRGDDEKYILSGQEKILL